MNNNWKQVKLCEISKIIMGQSPPSKYYNEQSEGIPFFQGVTEFQEIFPKVKKFTTKITKLAKSGDILMSVRAPVGELNILNIDCCIGRGLCAIKSEKNARFIYYILKNYKKYIKKYSGGITYESINKELINNLEFFIPENIAERNKITSILSAYDDLIENNNRRIEVLEEIAQAIYKEWFVHFRFPGYEKVKMVDSELGKIPEGWEAVRVGERFSTLLGGTPSRIKDEYWTGGNIPWINSGKVNELRVIDESEFITELGLRKSSTKMMPKRTTVVAITGATLGQVSLLEIKVCANQSVVGIYDSEHLFDEYIYFKFCEIIRSVISKSSGGAQQHINKDIVNSEKILTPTINIIFEFNKIIRPICNLIKNLLTKNKILKSKRDLLLLKLISGEIDVSDLDINTGDIK